MVKTRMTTADVAAEVCCLRKLIGMRCANIYDLSPKTYLIKLAKSSGVAESGESERKLLLLESGIRLHTTEFARDKSSTPSGFTLKLRKHVRTRRLEDVRQLGIDRVVDFQFGLGESAHHIILELYSQGNILLTDADYNILILLRSHRDDSKGLTMLTRHQYPIHSCRLFSRCSAEKIQLAIQSAFLEQGKEPSVEESSPNIEEKHGKKGKDDNGSLKGALGETLGYGPALTEHLILSGRLLPNMKTGPLKLKGLGEDQLNALLAAIQKFEDWLENVVKGLIFPEGYIFMKKKEKPTKRQADAVEGEDASLKIYDEFSPLPLEQLANRERLKVETFDAAMDEFFSKIEGQRAEQQKKSQEAVAVSKLEKIRADQANRAMVLKEEVDQSVRMAELLEYNLKEVDEAISAVRSALASGMDWKDLATMVKDEKKAGNPVAGLIHSLQLDKNQITLLLSNSFDEDEKTRPADKVEVDLGLSAHANARRQFEMKKKHAFKQEKTVAAHEKAFKAAERKTQQQLAQAKSVAAISHLRKVHWFEKFNWFVSSENYLIISGRDAQQNELVVKRYMKKGDIYVHADLHGAASTVIKNCDPCRPVPPLTINQAGSFTVCRSQAWDSKIVTSAWWVHDHQVTKTAPTGEYLTVGSFMIRGTKNFLPPNPLVMGFGLLFRFDESSIAAHLNERRIRGEDEGEDQVVSMLEDGSGRASSVASGMKVMWNEGTQGSDPTTDLVGLEKPEGGGSEGENNEEEEFDITNGERVVFEGSDGSEEIEDEAQNTEEDHLMRRPLGDHGNATSATQVSALDELLDRALELRATPNTANYASKYGLASGELSQQSQMAAAETVVPKAVQRDRPYLSKAERRRLKKGCRSGVEEESGAKEVEGTRKMDPSEQDMVDNSAKDQTGLDAVGKPVRGKKGKIKKMKEKYYDQDEDDRQLRMSLLASAGVKEAQTVAAVGRNDKSKLQVPRGKEHGGLGLGGAGVQEEAKICYKCKKAGHVARDCPANLGDGVVAAVEDVMGRGNILSDLSATEEVAQNFGDVQASSLPPEGQGKAVEEGLRRKARAKMVEQEIASIRAEENLVELCEEQRARLTELDTLTGNPLQDDVLLYAVPVCGPYGALQGYKYRVKLTPGAAKKGKGAKTAMDVFSHMPEATTREKELMKAMTDPELAAAMMGNVKVTAPGLTKMKQSQKKGKKTGSKASKA